LSTVYIALGSNVGDRIFYLRKAIEELINDGKISIESASSVYETLPYGNKEQGNFYNAVIKISTSYTLHELLNLTKNIEKKLGRVKKTRWGPREIDLDLLFYDSIVYSDKSVTVPHKEVIKRDFVLVPLCEIEPEIIHPSLNIKLCEIKLDAENKNVIGKIAEKIF